MSIKEKYKYGNNRYENNLIYSYIHNMPIMGWRTYNNIQAIFYLTARLV